MAALASPICARTQPSAPCAVASFGARRTAASNSLRAWAASPLFSASCPRCSATCSADLDDGGTDVFCEATGKLDNASTIARYTSLEEGRTTIDTEFCLFDYSQSALVACVGIT